MIRSWPLMLQQEIRRASRWDGDRQFIVYSYESKGGRQCELPSAQYLKRVEFELEKH